MKTERTECTFTIKEFGDGIPWIMIEEYAPGISILQNGFMGLEIREGVTFAEVKELAKLLHDKLAKVSFTHLK